MWINRGTVLGLASILACAGPPQTIECIIDEDCASNQICRQLACVDLDASCEIDCGVDAGALGPDTGPMEAGTPEAGVAADGSLAAPFDRHNIVFVTSEAYQPGAIGGLEEADAICQMHAQRANLPRPDTYVALLSNGETSAFSRIAGSRGWVRVDGLPFANEVSDISAGTIWYPVALSEVGLEPAVPLVASGTGADLSSRGGSCEAWTSTSAGQVIPVGDSRDGTLLWLDYFTASLGERWRCDDFLGLYCFGTGLDEAIEAPRLPPDAKIAFVSESPVASGGGLESFDAHCNGEAQAAGFGAKRFRALIAPGPGLTALSRFNGTDGPWFRPDGVKVAEDIRTLAANELIAPVNLDARGLTYRQVLTMAGAAGTRNDAAHCGNWMSTQGQTRIGKSGSSTRFFLGEFVPCSTSAHLLCFEVERE